MLGRSLDELPPQTRRVLGLIVAIVAPNAQRDRFRAHVVLGAASSGRTSGATRAEVHLERLVELEYMLMHRCGRGQWFEYELLFDGAVDAQNAANNGAHASGLLDVAALKARGAQHYEVERSGPNSPRSGVGRGGVGPQSGGGRGADRAANAMNISLCAESALSAAQPRSNGARPAVAVVTEHASA